MDNDQPLEAIGQAPGQPEVTPGPSMPVATLPTGPVGFMPPPGGHPAFNGYVWVHWFAVPGDYYRPTIICPVMELPAPVPVVEPESPQPTSSAINQHQGVVSLPRTTALPAPRALVAPPAPASRTAPATARTATQSRLTVFFNEFQKETHSVSNFVNFIEDFKKLKILSDREIGLLTTANFELLTACLTALKEHAEMLQIQGFTSGELVHIASMRDGHRNIKAIAKYDQAAREQDRRVSTKAIIDLFDEYKHNPVHARQSLSVANLQEDYLEPLSGAKFNNKLFGY